MNFENLKSNLSKYHYSDSLIKLGFQKALSRAQKALRKLNEKYNEKTYSRKSNNKPSIVDQLLKPV